MSDDRLVSVEIHGQRYPIRSSLDQEYVMRLAAFVDQKIAAAAESTPTSDSHRLAVLAALNIADELFRMREATRARHTQMAERDNELEELLDKALAS